MKQKNNKKRKSPKVIFARIDPYCQSCTILIGATYVDALNLLRNKKFILPERGEVNAKKIEQFVTDGMIKQDVTQEGLTIPLPYGFMVIFQDEVPDAGTIAHEAVHVATGVMDRAGVKISYDNDEVIAYHVGDFITQMEKIKPLFCVLL